jgi:excisionase family DNA binding protein
MAIEQRARLADLHDEDFLTVAEFASALRVARRTVRKWIDARALTVHDFEGVRRIQVADARAFMQRNRLPAA